MEFDSRMTFMTQLLSDSHQATIERFTTSQAATIYEQRHINSPTHRREVQCIRQGLANVPAGSRILDLPCGAGRFLPTFLDMNLQVTCADVSANMVEAAKRKAEQAGTDLSNVRFQVADVMNTPFADKEFDAILCNRLFHHFREPDVRRRALKELARICRGPLVVSFFCSQSLDGVYFHVRDALRSKKADDRIPISFNAFARDIEAAGLKIVQMLPMRGLVSKQWYVVLQCND